VGAPGGILSLRVPRSWSAGTSNSGSSPCASVEGRRWPRCSAGCA